MGLALLVLARIVLAAKVPEGAFQFAILGDRTGETVAGVYQEAWRETAAERPAFVVNVGDTIQGGNDATVNAEWRSAWRLLLPYRRYRVFFTPGNHDVWSAASAEAYEKYTKHPLHYSFDYREAHFTVLDNSRSDDMPASELEFLRNDLEAHKGQRLKFIFLTGRRGFSRQYSETRAFRCIRLQDNMACSM